MKRMVLNLLWLAAIITSIELLTAHKSSPKDYQGWAKNYLEQNSEETILEKEIHFCYVADMKEELICNICE